MAEAPIQRDDSRGGEEGRETAFDLLAEGVQRQLYRMGWKSLRPIQVEAIRAYARWKSDLLIMAARGCTIAELSTIFKIPDGTVKSKMHHMRARLAYALT